jgi:hypothetical protein
MATTVAGCAAAAVTVPVIPEAAANVHGLQERIARATETLSLERIEAERWLALYRQFCVADDSHRDAYNALDEACRKARKSHPNRNDCIRAYALVPSDAETDTPAFRCMAWRQDEIEREDIEKWYDQEIAKHKAWTNRKLLKQIEENRAKSLGQFDKWETACEGVDACFQIAELSDVECRAIERRRAAMAILVDTPATSIAGVAAKLAMWAKNVAIQCDISDPWPRGQTNPELISAWKDALALAGLPEGLGLEDYKKWLIEASPDQQAA